MSVVRNIIKVLSLIIIIYHHSSYTDINYIIYYIIILDAIFEMSNKKNFISLITFMKICQNCQNNE